MASPMSAEGPRGVEELRAGETENRNGCLAGPFDEVLNEIEQRFLRPVNVLEHENERLLLRKRLEELAVGPEGLLRAVRQLGVGSSGWTDGKAPQALL